jgi:hypothetical protein
VRIASRAPPTWDFILFFEWCYEQIIAERKKALKSIAERITEYHIAEIAFQSAAMQGVASRA